MVAAARAAGAHRGSFRQAGDVVDTAGADASVGAFLQRLFHVAMNSRGATGVQAQFSARRAAATPVKHCRNRARRRWRIRQNRV